VQFAVPSQSPLFTRRISPASILQAFVGPIAVATDQHVVPWYDIPYLVDEANVPETPQNLCKGLPSAVVDLIQMLARHFRLETEKLLRLIVP
jgi:hypothetical protein